MADEAAVTGPSGQGYAPTPWATDTAERPAPAPARASHPAPPRPPSNPEVEGAPRPDDVDATYWPGMMLSEPVTTLRRSLASRVLGPLFLFIGAIVMAFVVAGGPSNGKTGAANPDQGDLTLLTLVPVTMGACAVWVLLTSLLAKVEISPDRIRVSWVTGFREVARSSVTGVVRRKGRYTPQHLVLAADAKVIKGSLLRGRGRPTWIEADQLVLPGVPTATIARLLDVEVPPLLDGPDAAEVGTDLRSAFWKDGKPGFLLWALLIAIVLCTAIIIWGTTGGTGPLNGSP